MSKFFRNNDCDITVIKKVETDMEITFPSSYIDFLSEGDGGEGSDDTNRYIYLWKCEDIPQYNKDYAIHQYLSKNFIVFGMDGDRGYFFDCREFGEPRIVSCEFGNLGIEEIKNEAESFSEFIKAWI